MAENSAVNTETLLSHPLVQDITGNINRESEFRMKFSPPECGVFSRPFVTLEDDDSYTFTIDREARKELPRIIGNKVQKLLWDPHPPQEIQDSYRQPRKIGIVFSGGPAPGGHNVIAGLYDAAKKANPENRIYGFLLGPDGIIENEAVELNDEMVNKYRNRGGFTMIKTGRTKIDSADKMRLSRETCRSLGLNALVVVGGDDSNTNAAFLAQEMFEDGVQVIGVPKTIDGDIQVRDDEGKILCAMSFGFHSAARAFAGAVSNLCTDSSSDVKYWHICKVMGRVASHLALEVGLQTHANLTLVGEELAEYVSEEKIRKAEAEGTVDYSAYGMTLRHLSRRICDSILRRAAVGKNYGVLVIPEGILEFINEIQIFIIKLNAIIGEYNHTHDSTFHEDFPYLRDKLEHLRKMAQISRDQKGISVWNARDDDLFNDIPDFFQEGLLMERDSHGNFPFSQVKTEDVLLGLVREYLKILQDQGKYKIGIQRDYYHKTLKNEGIDPQKYGPVLFRNYPDGEYLLFNTGIISLKTLKNELVKNSFMGEEDNIPASVEKIFKKSLPNFKTQTYFYGYDGRGSDPTLFDCYYTYNLGLTVFSLIANGATGQMAAIKNLEHGFSQWEPIGIPIAPLMHLEERKGKLALVLEKSVVDIESPAFRVFKEMREKWLAAEPGEDNFRRPAPISLFTPGEEDRPITLALNALRNAG
ncbi:MAG: 6-phosphofructokinase [Desulfococcaceae bacterium]|jgi:pyrophosphate--fructose-6-phosphate 1-phosphotransferase|nr:6-phosphofructokinase [Desulfococcaceae bacterium]